MRKQKGIQLQGAKASGELRPPDPSPGALPPGTPLGALPPDSRYRLALRARWRVVGLPCAVANWLKKPSSSQMIIDSLMHFFTLSNRCWNVNSALAIVPSIRRPVIRARASNIMTNERARYRERFWQLTTLSKAAWRWPSHILISEQNHSGATLGVAYNNYDGQQRTNASLTGTQR